MFCSKCGKHMPENSRFCSGCGFELQQSLDNNCNNVIYNSSRILRIPKIIIGVFAGIFIISNIYIEGINKDKNNEIQTDTKTSIKTEVLDETLLYSAKVKNDANIYTAASVESPKDDTGLLEKGDKIYVLYDDGEWLKIRVTPRNMGWQGFVEKKHIADDTIERIDATVSEYLKNKNTEKACGKVDEMFKEKFIEKYDINLNTAYVTSNVWSQMNVNQKESLIRMLSSCYSLSGSTARVNIYDFYSGKKIASYATLGGIKYY